MMMMMREDFTMLYQFKYCDSDWQIEAEVSVTKNMVLV